ncbi:MAG: metallophosphoesterase [Clostridia bacterium]|nr:metallophosphoesterase [Clostridia bacterium]
MYIINMVFNVIVSALIVIQSAFALPFNTVIFCIDNGASVFETGDNMYTVIWSTSLPGTGYVTYNYGGEEYTVKDESNGVIRSTDSIHSVRIPKEHLDGNTYTYHSQYVGTRRAYVAVKGRTVSSKPVAFRGYSGQDEIHVLFLSDIHENPSAAAKAVKNLNKDADLIIMNGDAVSFMTAAYKFKQVLSYAYRFSDGSIPVIYTRGNHENRGEYGSEAVEIFKTSTGGMYFTCNYGPVQFLCLDSGEDKSDSDFSYSGLVDYTSYIARETEWMRSLTLDEDAKYRIGIAHIPRLSDRYGNNWSEILEYLGIDLFIAGHKHRINFEYSKDQASFPLMLDGGKNGDDRYIATMVNIRDSEIYVESYDNEGTMRGDYTYTFSS